MNPILVEVKGNKCFVSSNPDSVPTVVANTETKVAVFKDKSHHFAIHKDFQKVCDNFIEKEGIVFICFNGQKAQVVRSIKGAAVCISYI